MWVKCKSCQLVLNLKGAAAHGKEKGHWDYEAFILHMGQTGEEQARDLRQDRQRQDADGRRDQGQGGPNLPRVEGNVYPAEEGIPFGSVFTKEGEVDARDIRRPHRRPRGTGR